MNDPNVWMDESMGLYVFFVHVQAEDGEMNHKTLFSG